MKLFDGTAKAAAKEARLKAEVALLERKPQIGAILFSEDAGSRLYTRLKKEAAERLGIQYHVHEMSVAKPFTRILDVIYEFNADPAITGVIIQKPTRRVWEQEMGYFDLTFQEWWEVLTRGIDTEKDVDGLHPSTLAAVADGTWHEKGRVLPATCQAVIDILEDFCSEIHSKKPEDSTSEYRLECLKDKKIIILGKSDLLGKPLYYYLHNLNLDVSLLGSKELTERVAAGVALRDADVVVTATGRYHLLTGEMIKQDAAVIDVGEPKADVEFQSVREKASFITPVPGGVGPLTVVCLMENAVKLLTSHLEKAVDFESTDESRPDR